MTKVETNTCQRGAKSGGDSKQQVTETLDLKHVLNCEKPMAIYGPKNRCFLSYK